MLGQQGEWWVSCFVLGALEKPFRRRDRCCSAGTSNCQQLVATGSDKQEGKAGGMQPRRYLYYQTTRESLFPEAEELGKSYCSAAGKSEVLS